MLTLDILTGFENSVSKSLKNKKCQPRTVQGIVFAKKAKPGHVSKKITCFVILTNVFFVLQSYDFFLNGRNLKIKRN